MSSTAEVSSESRSRRDRYGAWASRIVFTAASGAVLYFSFAPRPLWWLAPVAFLGLGMVLHTIRSKHRFWSGFGYGFLFGLSLYLPLLSWLQDFLGTDFGPWPWLGLSAALAVYFGLASGLASTVARLPGSPLWMALIVIAMETPQAWFPLGGFPWGRIGFSQPEGAFLSLAAIGGAPLVGLAVVLTGFGFATIITRLYSQKVHLGQMLRPAIIALTPIILGLALWPTIGTEPQVGTKTVATVQGNVPSSGLTLFVEGADLRATHLEESQRLLADVRTGKVPQPDLLIWPETATDVRGTGDPELNKLTADFNAPGLFGAVYVRPDGQLENAVVNWDPRTGPGERYTKQQLVPFGEYVPARGLAELVTPFVSAVDERVAGNGQPAVLTAAGTRVGVMICYEAAYDYPARNAVHAGAELLIAPTNNAWYGRSEMSYQQLAMSRLRAVEHGRAVIVSATSGVSAIVMPDGTITQSTELFTADSLVATVPLRTTVTVADRLGATVEYTIVGSALAGILLSFITQRRTKPVARHTTSNDTEGAR